MSVIHKAVRPKVHYCDPTLCGSFVYAHDNSPDWSNASKRAHKFSRVRWDKVTCQLCLKKKGRG